VQFRDERNKQKVRVISYTQPLTSSKTDFYESLDVESIFALNLRSYLTLAKTHKVKRISTKISLDTVQLA
jgi:hypothetical protein